MRMNDLGSMNKLSLLQLFTEGSNNDSIIVWIDLIYVEKERVEFIESMGPWEENLKNLKPRTK